MLETITPMIPIIISAVLVGFYGAVKYYAKKLGSNPESFELKKFLPIVVLSILVSVGYSIGGTNLTSSDIASFVTENFVLVIFIDQAITIYTRSKVQSPAISPPAAP